MLIVAERINASRKTIHEALEARDADFIRQEARAQAEAGADFIDVNAGTFPGQETELLPWLVNVVQEVTDAPLCRSETDTNIFLDPFELPGRPNKVPNERQNPSSVFAAVRSIPPSVFSEPWHRTQRRSKIGWISHS